MSNLIRRIKKLKAGKKNKRLVKYPGSDEKVVVRVLTCAEIQNVNLAVETHFRSLDINYSMDWLLAQDDTNRDEETIQTIWKAFTDKDGKPLADDIDELRANLTDTEKNYLITEYNIFQMECSPDLGEMPVEEFNDFVEDVKKNTDSALLNITSTSLLKRLVRSLVVQDQNSQTDNGPT